MIVGEVYEIEPLIVICFNGVAPPKNHFAKLIGFSSQNYPVFERDGRFFSVDPIYAIITPLKKAVE